MIRLLGFLRGERFALLTLCLLLSCLGVAEEIASPERVLWEKRPIPVHIQLNRERIIHFPDDIRYWLPDTLKNKVTMIAASGVLYVRALNTFPKTRIRVQGMVDQQIYLLDVFADDSASVSDELIVMTAASVHNRAKTQSSMQSSIDWRVRLTRYAAQQLYAPERLAEADPKIERVDLEISSIPLVRGQQIEAIPLASWRGGGLTLTAVKLRNATDHPLQLVLGGQSGLQTVDLATALRGDWLTATCQHYTLGAHGDENDTTTLYLVSKRSFVESLGFIAGPQTAFEEAGGG